jgi:N6-adenosine-specific RNA methylase IME4
MTLVRIPQGTQAGAIMADPPWPYVTYSEKGQQKSASQHYAIQELEQIKAVPVATCAARDCWLFLWCPGMNTPAVESVMSAWGFTFSGSGFAWAKTTKHATVTPLEIRAAKGAKSPWHFGLGHTTRKSLEFCWLGRRGKPPRLDKGVYELIVAPAREHSRKPDEVYARIMRYCAGPYLELYARQQWPGWIAWGDEVEKFHGGAAA